MKPLQENRLTTLANQVYDLKDQTERKLDSKFAKLDEAVSEIKDTTKEIKGAFSDTNKRLDKVEVGFENLSDEVVDILKEIKEVGLKGDKGEDANEEAMEERLLAKIPTMEELVKEIPTKDELVKEVIKQIPQSKPSLKVIQESIDIDEVVEKVEEKLNKKPLEIHKVNGLQGKLDNILRDIARGGYHGGGDTVVAGTNVTITTVGGNKVISSTGGSGGTPGGSDTQVQFNDGGSFGGDAGLTYNKTTDSLTIGGGLTVDTNTLYVDATNNKVGIGTASPLTQTGNVLQVGSTAAVNQYLVFQTNNGTERGIQYYLLDGTTLRGYMKWDGEEDLLLKGDTLKISTQNVTNPFHFGDGGGIGLFGIGTTAPTHSLTLNSTSTGIALYNTADQTTNYERGLIYWSGNVFNIFAGKGGSGTSRNVYVGTTSRNIKIIESPASAAEGFLTISGGTSSTANTVAIAHGKTTTSGTTVELSITPTYNQSSTAGYTALLVNPTETTTGSGSKLLADFQVGGSSKVAITNTGNIGIGTITPTAGVHLKAGTATASTAPLKFTAGTVNTTPEAGTIEFTNAEDGLTFTAVSTRRKVVLDTATQTLTNKTLTTPVINGATLNGDLQIDATPNTDDTWNGKSTNTFNAGATIAQFDCVYLSSSSTWLLTDADAIGTAGNVLVMMAGEAGTDTNPLRVIEPGSWVRNDAWNWTIGGVLYLDTATPGGMTQTAPSGEDDAVKIVGHAVTADVIYFAPSPNWIIYAA